MLYETIAFPDNAPLQCSIVEVEEYPFHMHDDVLEIMFALEGSFELTVVNNVLDMKAGDIYVSCPRELHRLCAYPHTRGTVMLLHINVEAYRAEFPDLRTYQFANSALENNTAGIQMLGSYLKKQLPRLLDRTGTETAAYREVGEKILNTLIKEFQCYYLGSGFPEFNNAYKGNELQLRRIRRITDYIYRNYNKPIRIEDVAAMLLEGGKGLQTIACECGFSKYKYFSDGFEKSFRTTPQQYRRRYQSRTIAVQAYSCRALEGQELELLLQKFCRKSEEISLDWGGRYEEKPLRRPRCVSLAGAAYDHITCFPELRRLREELGLDTVALDLDFLRRYRNSPRVLNYILNDLWSLRMRLRVCVPPGEPLRGLREELEPLRERFLRPGGELEVIVLAAPGEEEHARTLAEALSAGRLPVRVTGAEHRPEANALYGSGYMPGYLIHTMASSRGSRMPRLTLLDGDSGVALLTPEGLKRPVYHLLSLLEQLGDTVIAQGDMYLAARQSGREDIQVLLYHYDACFDTLFEGGSRVEEQATFVELMKDHDYNREVTLSVRGMTGRFAIRKYRLTSEEYASRYRDFPLPPADGLSAETLRVLNGTLAPEMSLNLLELDGAYHLTLKLAPFEILLLCFEKLYNINRSTANWSSVGCTFCCIFPGCSRFYFSRTPKISAGKGLFFCIKFSILNI